MIYGLPARESRTDGRLHFRFFFFISYQYIKIRVYNNIIRMHDDNIIIYYYCPAWVYNKVLYNVIIISAARGPRGVRPA